MEVIKYNNTNLSLGNLSVAIGAFDGIHKGHIEIFKNLGYLDYKKAIITFTNHPDYTLGKRENDGFLCNETDKLEIFKLYDIDYVIYLDNDILKMTYDEFNKFLYKLGVRRVVVGSDFCYGYNALGNTQTLKQMFTVKIVNTITEDNIKMSSSIMRKLLEEGDLESLSKKGYPNYHITGKVVSGKRLGSKLGFPTANLLCPDIYKKIKNGVYKTLVEYDNKSYLGIANVGINPSVDNLKEIRVEVHIIDFNEDIYGKYIKVTFLKFLRPEIKFNNIEELKNQVLSDIENVKNENI